MPRSARTKILFLALAAATIGVACQPVPPTTKPSPPTTTTPPPASTGWRVVGGDEFTSTTIDASRWVPYHNTYGDGNAQLGCNTPANVWQSNGTMKLASRREAVTCPGGKARSYTSSFVGSREAGRYYPAYGRFEVRAKLPHAQGLWPAFWLRHRNGAGVAEIDVMEYFHSQVPGRTTGTLHLDGVSNVSKATRSFEAPTASPGWHTWATEIEPEGTAVRFRFLLDGVQYHTYLDRQHRWTTSAPASGTWDLALDMAVGGSWVGRPDGALGYLEDIGRCAQGGTAPSGCSTSGVRRVSWSNPATTTMEVDWVRVSVRP